METTPLGTTGESVSALCLGTMYFGSRTDPETSWDILDAYYEAGGRFLDTANKYATWVDGYDEPESEPLLGEWMAERGNRDDLFVATKVGFPYPGVERGLSPDQIEREVEGSLDRLGIDTIDLLYAHGDDHDTSQEAYMEAFHRLVEDGKVRHLGASNFFAWRLARANRIAAEHDWTPFSVVQPRFSYLVPNRGEDFGRQVPATDELVVYCEEHDIPFVPFSPLLQGAYGREDRPIPDEYVNTENRVKIRTVEELAEEHDATGNQIVLAWMTQRDPAAIPLFGCSSVAQLEENLASLSIDLSDSDLERLDEIDRLGDVNR
jgi:aryl-alcohol dehydrogenase-like predicted oxidoreductase